MDPIPYFKIMIENAHPAIVGGALIAFAFWWGRGAKVRMPKSKRPSGWQHFSIKLEVSLKPTPPELPSKRKPKTKRRIG